MRLPDHEWWDNRFVQQAYSPSVRARSEQLWAEKDILLTVLADVPEVFSHFDFQRRNLFIHARDDGQCEVVAIDWAQVGWGALGGDLAQLIWHSSLVFDVEPDDVPELETIAFDAYVAGLHDGGWEGNPNIIQVGYTTWLALWIGAGIPAVTALWTSTMTEETMMHQFNRRPEAAAAGWATLCELALERADEIPRLVERLGTGK